ncbi:MAG TPA: hypothetical protein VKD71_09460 [Gemmataceae bacterium]|nr:hypothetical protein [Gemmataceae bacterium]
MPDKLAAADRLRAVRKGVRGALREHALLGRSVSIWRDGKIIRLSPAEILAELDAESSKSPAEGNSKK